MNLKKLTTSSLLLAIGFILHQIAPPILMGMKPDFLLAMMFIAIIIADEYKMTLIIGIAAGIITAATTAFPGGQVPNIVDKLVTAHLVYGLHKVFINQKSIQLKIIIISAIGTIISGTTFLFTALLLVGLPASFNALILTVVLPATIINCGATFVLYNAVSRAMRTRRQ